MEMTQQIAAIPDKEIIDRILGGEKGLFEILVRRNNPYLYKTGRSYGYGHEDTEDLMQEAFISAYRNLGAFEYRSSFKTWITRIMLNACYHKSKKMSFKKEQPGAGGFSESQVPQFESGQTPDPGNELVNKELGKIVGEALTRIPEEYRMVFSLRELSGLNTNEAAEVLDISPVNVKVRLNRAKHMLRAVIERMYKPEDIFEFNLIYCDKMVHRVLKAINE